MLPNALANPMTRSRGRSTGLALLGAFLALYAGTLPHGKIFTIDAQGKATLFSQPAETEHIWALAYDAIWFPCRRRQATCWSSSGWRLS